MARRRRPGRAGAGAGSGLGAAERGRSGATYVQARTAAMNGNHAEAAQLLATLASSQPDVDIAKKALSEAIGAGSMDLALNLARTIPAAKLPTDARLLLVVDEIKHRRADKALPWLSAAADNGDLSFLAPLVTAWEAADRGNVDQALTAVDQIPVGSLLGPLRAEERALILLEYRRTAEAEPFARRAIGSGGRARGPLAAGLRRRLPRCRRQGARADDARWDGRRWCRRAAKNCRRQIERPGD